MHRKSCKRWWNAISCGDGWNAFGHGHTKKRTKGRKKIRRAARQELKHDLRRLLAAEG